MRKLYENFHIFHFQKRIVSADIRYIRKPLGRNNKGVVKLPHHKNAYSISMYSFRENDSFLKEENMEIFIQFPHYGNFLLHKLNSCRGNQSHYREVLRWEIFMEQKLRFWQSEPAQILGSTENTCIVLPNDSILCLDS